MATKRKKDKQKLYEVLKKIGAHIESFGLGCIIVDNVFRKKNGDSSTHCFIITQPNPREESLTREDIYKRLKEAKESYKGTVEDRITLSLGATIVVDSVYSWLDLLDRNGTHPILSCDPIFGATDVFLSGVVYGTAKHEILVRAFQDKYGPDFIQECHRVFVDKIRRRQKKLANLNRRVKRETDKRKNPLNYYEIQDIKNLLFRSLEVMKERHYEAIVGIDCSGRPLAVMLRQLLEKIGYSPLPLLDFLDIHHLREALVQKELDAEIPETYTEVFKKELPQIHRLLEEDPEQVLFVDDQIYSYAHTSSTIIQLVKRVSGREKIKLPLIVLSGFNGYNAPTWWKDKNLLRIKNNKESSYPTLQAIPRQFRNGEEERIKEFEDKLSAIVEKFARSYRRQNSLV